ncbi:CYTH domain-containing protein [Pseudomonadota bacterium]
MFAWKLFAASLVAFLLCVGDSNAATALARKNEIKLFITAANTEQALKALKLDMTRAKKRTVCFFDTAERSLSASHLILRARQSSKGRTDSTVKLRVGSEPIELSDAELAIQPEQDWTNEIEPTHSRSLDYDWPVRGLLSEVVAGQQAVIELFTQEQQELVKGRMKDLNWADLRLYGPVEILIWRKHLKLDGFPEDVTIELWNLQKDGKTLDILEVSAKVKAETDQIAKDLARQFYRAARDAGMGEPTGQTKTQMVLDFFQPGR